MHIIERETRAQNISWDNTIDIGAFVFVSFPVLCETARGGKQYWSRPMSFLRYSVQVEGGLQLRYQFRWLLVEY
jgi:hypothetical protein